MRMCVLSYILITLIWCDVLLLFYLMPTNTIVLTLYILVFHLFSKKPRPNHLGKTAGVPKIRAPPHKQRAFEEL
jgi:hypothetical protein